MGFKFTDSLKLSVGVRYTSDEKKGNVKGLVVETGDRFSPNDPRANVTIEALCRAPDGTVVRTPTVAGRGHLPRAEQVDLRRRRGLPDELLARSGAR